MDELKEAQRWLAEAASLLDRAQRAHAFMGIERDIVLGKLARAYELVAAASIASPLARSGAERAIIPPVELKRGGGPSERQPEADTPPAQAPAAERSAPPSTDEVALAAVLAAADDLTMEIEASQTTDDGPSAEPALPVSRQQTEIVSDRFRTSTMLVNEQLGGTHAAPSRASKLQNRRIDDLGKSIGLNDKHVFIKELFGGSAERYAATINRVNQIGDLNSAIIYLQENFSWSDDSQAAMQFIDLVRRKFL